MQSQTKRPCKLETETPHRRSLDRNMLCSAEVGSGAIPRHFRLDLQLHSERNRRLTQRNQPGCPTDAEALSDHGRSTRSYQSGPWLSRELDQQFSRPDEPDIQYVLYERSHARSATIRKHSAQQAVSANPCLAGQLHDEL